MDASALLALLFLIPCALMVVLMLRGHGHAHGSHQAHSRNDTEREGPA